MVVSSLRPISNVDFWWHLATGRYIAKTGIVPTVDIFSFTCAGRRWIDGYWLYELILFGLYSLGGFTAIIVGKSLFLALIFFVLRQRLCDSKISWIWQLLFLQGTFMAAALGSQGWPERADLVTLFFLVLLFWHLDRDYGTHRWNKSRWLWPAAFTLWANSHPGFILGLAAAGLYVGTESLCHGRSLRQTVLWLCACFMGTLLNPHGIVLYNSLYEGTRNSSFIGEWFPPAWQHFHIFWICIFVFWFIIAWQIWKGNYGILSRLPGCLFFTWLSIRHALGVPFFLLCIFPYALEFFSRSAVLAVVDRFVEQHVVPVSAVLMMLLFTCLICAVGRAGTGVDFRQLPAKACEFISSEKLGGRFFNDYNFGSYWIWRFGGYPPDFIDGRYPTVEGYRELNNHLVQARNGAPEQWNTFLNQYGITAALVAYPAPSSIVSIFHDYFSASSWALVYWDDLSAIFVKRTPDYQKTISAYEFRHIYPDMSAAVFSQYVSQISPSQRSRLRENIERNARLHPESRRTQSFLALLDQVK